MRIAIVLPALFFMAACGTTSQGIGTPSPQNNPPPTGALAQCHAQSNGELPDSVCTPGAVAGVITTTDLCPRLGSNVVRSVSQKTKDAVKVEYGYSVGTFPGEIDHLVPLELGGSNDIKNLWPESGKIPNPKDAVENRLHDQVCAGTITLQRAQYVMMTDWRMAP